MLLSQDKELAKLPDSLPQVQAVYPNLVLRIPRLVSTRNIPIPIRENKISSWALQKTGGLSTWGTYGARAKAYAAAYSIREWAPRIPI